MKIGDTLRVGGRGYGEAATLRIDEFCDEPNRGLLVVEETRDSCPQHVHRFLVPYAWWAAIAWENQQTEAFAEREPPQPGEIVLLGPPAPAHQRPLVGSRLVGPCGDIFGRDNYGDKIVIALGRQYVVAEEMCSGTVVAATGHGVLEALAEHVRPWKDDAG